MSIFHDAHRYVAEYGYAAIGLGILLEDFGLPAPGETLLITGALLAAHDTLDIWLLLAVAWVGAVVGDNIGFAIGWFGGHRLILRYGARVGITEERLARVRRFFDRYGGWVIVFARFVVILRQLNGIVAGTLEMHWVRFVLLNALGAALWVAVWGGGIYWLGRRAFHMFSQVEHAEPLLIGAAVIIGLAVLAWHLFWQWRGRKGGGTGAE